MELKRTVALHIMGYKGQIPHSRQIGELGPPYAEYSKGISVGEVQYDDHPDGAILSSCDRWSMVSA